MGVTGSLPPSAPPPPSSMLNDTTEISYKESIPSIDECSYCVMTFDEIDSNTNSSLNSNSNNNKDKSNCRKHSRVKSPLTVTYGPINVKIRQTVAPTLATGRRSKFIKLEGDEATKRELRRKKNREAARRLKEKRASIEQQLEKEISELESKEQDLLLMIQNLKSYKEYCETQYRHIITIKENLSRTASSTLKQIQYNRRQIDQSIPVHYNDTHIKEEPRSTSPQWQLFFSI